MKKFVIGIVVVGLTVVLGVTGTYVFNRVYIRFENIAVGSTVMPPDGRGVFTSYKASDGVNLNLIALSFHLQMQRGMPFRKS
jgi:hypothetical protein